MSDLKPCPFCGGTAISVKNIEPRLYRPVRNHPYAVVCWECDLFFGYDEDYGGRFDTENEAIEAWNRRAKENQDAEFHCVPVEDIKAAPTIEPERPEIIRCRDCKYRMPYDWMFSEIWRSQNISEYSEDEIGCQYCDMTMTADDFCSHAERREE